MRGAERGANWLEPCRPPRAGRYPAPMALLYPHAGLRRQARQLAPSQRLTRRQWSIMGRRFLPPPPPLHSPKGGELGRERPPCLARDMVFRPFPGGRSRPDSAHRPFGRLCPRVCRRACTVHDAEEAPVRPRHASRQCAHTCSHPLPTSPWKDAPMSVINPEHAGSNSCRIGRASITRPTRRSMPTPGSSASPPSTC